MRIIASLRSKEYQEYWLSAIINIGESIKKLRISHQIRSQIRKVFKYRERGLGRRPSMKKVEVINLVELSLYVGTPRFQLGTQYTGNNLLTVYCTNLYLKPGVQLVQFYQPDGGAHAAVHHHSHCHCHHRHHNPYFMTVAIVFISFTSSSPWFSLYDCHLSLNNSHYIIIALSWTILSLHCQSNDHRPWTYIVMYNIPVICNITVCVDLIAKSLLLSI
jgi:hypothetical protein